MALPRRGAAGRAGQQGRAGDRVGWVGAGGCAPHPARLSRLGRTQPLWAPGMAGRPCRGPRTAGGPRGGEAACDGTRGLRAWERAPCLAWLGMGSSQGRAGCPDELPLAAGPGAECGRASRGSAHGVAVSVVPSPPTGVSTLRQSSTLARQSPQTRVCFH